MCVNAHHQTARSELYALNSAANVTQKSTNQTLINRPAGRTEKFDSFFLTPGCRRSSEEKRIETNQMVEPIDHCVKLFIDIKAELYKERERDCLGAITNLRVLNIGPC